MKPALLLTLALTTPAVVPCSSARCNSADAACLAFVNAKDDH
jgi:hypothetical protein